MDKENNAHRFTCRISYEYPGATRMCVIAVHFPKDTVVDTRDQITTTKVVRFSPNIPRTDQPNKQ